MRLIRRVTAGAFAASALIALAVVLSNSSASAAGWWRPAPRPSASPSASPSVSPSTSPSVSPSTSPSTSPSSPTGSWWRPTAGVSWQWQLTGTLDRSVNAAVYDIDAFDATAADVSALHAAGRKVICYVNAGGYENWRPDASRFPSAVLGKALDGWAGERWLDIRRWDLLEPIMTERFTMCRQKGFDAVEPDNVDGYTNSTGFALTATDQLTYNRRLADLAHRLGLAVGLKNDIDQVGALQPSFDFAVNEECFQYSECGVLSAFIKAGKPVFHVEYEVATSRFCPTTRGLGFSSMRKDLDLTAWRESC